MQAGSGRRQDDGGVSAEAGRGGEAEEASASLSVIGAGEEAREWGDGCEQKIELMKKLVVLLAKGGVALAELADFVLAEGRTPFETGGDDWIEFVEEAGVDFCCLGGLEGGVDVPGFGPEGWIEGLDLAAGAAEAILPGLHCGVNRGFAGFEKGSGEDADAGCRLQGGVCGREIEERFGQQGQVAQVPAEPAKRVERWREVVATGPVADAEGGAIAGEQSAAGPRTEPPVSVPMAAIAEPSWMDAAAPLEEPPVRRVASAGWRQSP